MKRRNLFLFKQLALLTAIFFSSNGYSTESPLPVHKQISEQLDVFTTGINQSNQYSRIEYEASLPDERLNLESCGAPLAIENRTPNRTLGRLTLRISCQKAQKPWAVNIGINLIAHDHVVVSSRPIPKGSKITANMLHLKETKVTQLHSGYYKDPKHIIGSISKYSIGGNRVIKPGNILPPLLVTKGEKVIINANTTGLSIRAYGIALSDGTLGEVVKVKNSQTTRIIEGRVSAAGHVLVSL